MKKYIFLLFLLFITLFSINLYSDDTDVYLQNVKPNAMILADTSGSMGWGVYEHTVDYGAYYDWASDQGDCDMIAGGCGTSNYFYNDHYNKNEILLVKGNIGVTIQNGVSFTGDPGDPDYIWYISNVIETGSYIDDNGNITDSSGRGISDSGYSGRITVDSDGHVLLDGEKLPLDRDIKLHDYVTYPDGTMVDNGFAGMINAPGWYFSGYEAIGSDASGHNVAEDGDTYIYFFIPGNWINMQEVYNLYTAYTTNEDYRTWKTRTYEESSGTYTPVTIDIHSPNYPSYYPNYSDQTWTITQIDASKVKLHFEDFYTEYQNSCYYDYVKIYKDSVSSSNLLDTFCGNKGSFTSSAYTLGSTKKLIIVFHSDYSVTKKGFKIDRYEYLPEDVESSGYKMQTRLEVVRDAMIDVIDATKGKINWALASFSVSPTGDGAKIWQEFDSSLSDDTIRENIVNYLDSFEAYGGTPLGEALQDVWNHFHSKSGSLSECAQNHVIVLSDGYPSADDDWSRISGVTFTDSDGDGWTEDPYQYSNPPDDYFDDVGHWMYTHSIVDKSSVSDPANSYANVRSHMLSFTMSSPLMVDAAEESGGVFIAAFNKQQLISAFYSLGILIANSISYTAPVVSVDTTNKTQSGEYIYMTFFKPKSPNWLGNLKKYKVSYKTRSDCNWSDSAWVVVDKNDIDATDCDGVFKDTSVSFWTDQEDGGEVEAGGVGKVLKDKLTDASLSDPYNTSYRKIYFIDSSNNITRFIPSNIPSGTLSESDTSEKYKIINYVYGYTYDEDNSSNHYPVAKRTWPLESMIHSEPVIINYESDNKTYIVAGGNDGQLHVFDDNSGNEVFSLIFDCFLTDLKKMNPNSADERPLYYVDGKITFYYEFDSDGKIVPKTLIVGLRRGGKKYYAFDIEDSNPENWTLKWEISGGSGDFAELGYSWSEFQITKMRIKSGSSTVEKTVGVFTGGYDPVEDDNSSPTTSVTMGRGIFIVDIDTGAKLYSYTYSDNSDMKYCIPASPMIITDLDGYMEKIYAIDIGGQLWRFTYDSSTDLFSGQIIFKSNPGSDSSSGDVGGTLTSSDSGRKFFYPPSVTILGKCSTNYAQGSIGFMTPALYFGSGNREDPLNTSTNNRIYMVIDDITSTSEYYTEQNLLNVTNDELDVDSGSTSSEKETILNKLHSAKGWFIKLGSITDSELHSGEKVLSSPILFNERAYFTTFVPISSDPCNPHGVSRVYSLKYCYGLAGLNYNTSNDDGDTEKFDKTDRYRTIGTSLPSGVKIAIREGHAWALISTGGGIPGAGELGSPNIPQESLNINIQRWEHFQNW